MPAIAVALAQALVERFKPLVPEDVLVMNDADMLVLRRDATRGWIGVGLDVSEIATDLELERAAHCALRALQEFLCEQLAHPWPTPSKHEACVRVDANEIHLWFGDPDVPALVLAPIQRAALR